MAASGAISENSNLYAAANGFVSTTVSGRRQAIALESAADGALFEAMPIGVTS